MLCQSRWASMQHSSKASSSEKIESHNDKSSSSSPTFIQTGNFSGRTDPALRLIDEEANKMDIDDEALSFAEGATPISLVIDTNVLLKYLDILQQFADDVERSRSSVSLVIPGVVVEELDYQKNNRSRHLCWAARMASTWILSKLKERRSVRGQAYQETLQNSGSWKRRDPGTSNDDLIVDCCLFLREKRGLGVLAISQDNNLCATAESQDIPTLNPKALSRWSSRSLALYVLGADYPGLNGFADYKETFRPKRVREALDDDLAVQAVKGDTLEDDDGMEVDDEVFISREPPPQHLLDDLHNQVLEHFGILLSELLRRVAPPTLFTQPSPASGVAASRFASPTSCKPAKDWKTKEILHYLCNAQRVPRTASAADVKELASNSSRMMDFFTHKYDARGRSGQHWARADWISCLEKLGVLGRVYEDEAIRNSLDTLAPQLELVFQTPMRPTGTGTF